MRRGKKVPFPSYQTRAPDGMEKRYIRLGDTLLLSAAMLSLRHLSFRIYVNMMLEAGGKAEFEFPYHKYKEYCSKDGFKNAVSELLQKGFIEVIENNKHRCKPNLYRFSDKWKNWIK